MADSAPQKTLDSNILQPTNTVYLIPNNGQCLSKEEIVSLLAGLPPLKSKLPTNRDSSVLKNTERSSNLTKPNMDSVFSGKQSIPIDCNEVVVSESFFQADDSFNEMLDTTAPIHNIYCTPTGINKILMPINHNILTPDASPVLGAHSSSPITTTRVKIYPNAIPSTPKSSKLTESSNEVTATPKLTASSNKTAVENVTPIGTLVFFDLETTGLGHIVGRSNVQITEISMIAIDRKEFWQSKNSELKDIRIIQKLSMCVRPRTAVSAGAAKITGLDNDNLIDQYPFDRNVASCIVSFLSHFPKPVCLLAHNGNAFDFPLLKAEFKRLSMELPSDLLLADTLIAFRSIGIAGAPPDRKVCKSVKYGKNGRLSHSLENLHLFFFNKKPSGGHSSEGDCLALAKVCHKLKDEAIPWIEANAKTYDKIQPMW